MKIKILMFPLLFLFNGTVFSQSSEKEIDRKAKRTRSCEHFYKSRLGDIEYQYCVNSLFNDAAKRDELVIDYTVKNSGKRNYVVYDGGAYRTYFVEQASDEAAEISLKVFTSGIPASAVCPTESYPMYRVSWLKARKSISEQISVPLPLRLDYPYYKCLSKPAQMSLETKKFKICLGVAQADKKNLEKLFSKETLLSKNTFFDVQSENWKSAIEEQQLLCSETFELK